MNKLQLLVQPPLDGLAPRSDLGTIEPPSRVPATAPVTGAVKVHKFHTTHHHPVIHFAQHWVSPLSASLLILVVHKSWQVSAMSAFTQAKLRLFRAGTLPLGGIMSPRQAAYGALAAAGFYGLYASAPALPTDDDAQLRSRLRTIYRPDVAETDVTHSMTNWFTTAHVNRMLYRLRERSQLPWWAVIAGVTLTLRCALVPVNVHLLRNSLRLKLILPQVNALASIVRDRRADAQQRLLASRELLDLLKQKRCSPWANVVVFPLLLPAVILSLFGAIDNLCLAEPSMSDGGALWFPDLIAHDTSMLLPILSCLTWLWQVEIGAGIHYFAMPGLRLAARMSAVAMIPLSATLPSGVFVFWITSNCFAIARGYATRTSFVRRLLHIPSRREIEALMHLPKHKAM